MLPNAPCAFRPEGLAVCDFDRGVQCVATPYTLIQAARINNIYLQAWLADVLARIADQPVCRLNELLPWTWQPR